MIYSQLYKWDINDCWNLGFQSRWRRTAGTRVNLDSVKVKGISTLTDSGIYNSPPPRANQRMMIQVAWYYIQQPQSLEPTSTYNSKDATKLNDVQRKDKSKVSNLV
jgi:hypothetical protein